uniref:Potassium channel domain-containing protein n=1 Tax=Palpitomonas bilix TaxID=652834 RepID=A0A7S3DLM2_9EUKA
MAEEGKFIKVGPAQITSSDVPTEGDVEGGSLRHGNHAGGSGRDETKNRNSHSRSGCSDRSEPRQFTSTERHSHVIEEIEREHAEIEHIEEERNKRTPRRRSLPPNIKIDEDESRMPSMKHFKRSHTSYTIQAATRMRLQGASMRRKPDAFSCADVSTRDANYMLQFNSAAPKVHKKKKKRRVQESAQLYANIHCITGLLPIITSVIAAEIDWHYVGQYERNTSFTDIMLSECNKRVESVVLVGEKYEYIGSAPELFAQLLRLISTLLCFVSIAFFWKYKFESFKLHMKDTKHAETFWRWRQCSLQTIESIILLYHIPPFLGRVYPTFTVYEEGYFMTYRLDDCLIFMAIRFYLFVRLLGNNSELNKQGTYMLGHFIHVGINFGMMVKYTIRKSPLRVVVPIVLIDILLFSYTIRVSERAVCAEYDSMAKSVWLILVTMTTVGYGDVFPRTIMGRSLMFIVAIQGLLLSALLIAMLSSKLAFSRQQKKFVWFIESQRREQLLRESAATVVALWWRYFQKRKRYERAMMVKAAKRQTGGKSNVVVPIQRQGDNNREEEKWGTESARHVHIYANGDRVARRSEDVEANGDANHAANGLLTATRPTPHQSPYSSSTGTRASMSRTMTTRLDHMHIKDLKKDYRKLQELIQTWRERRRDWSYAHNSPPDNDQLLLEIFKELEKSRQRDEVMQQKLKALEVKVNYTSVTIDHKLDAVLRALNHTPRASMSLLQDLEGAQLSTKEE